METITRHSAGGLTGLAGLAGRILGLLVPGPALFLIPLLSVTATGMRESPATGVLSMPVELPPPPIELPAPVVRIALLAGTHDDDPIRTGAERAAREISARAVPGSRVVVPRGGTQYDRSPAQVDLQISMVEDAVARGAMAIIVDPVHPEALVPYLANARDAGVLVVTVNNRLATGVRGGPAAFHVATDPVASAATVVDAIGALIGTPSVAGIVASRAADTRSADRRGALMERFEQQHPHVRVVAPLSPVSGGASGLEAVVMGILAAHREVPVIIATDGGAMAGAVRAVSRAGRSGVTAVVGFDPHPEMIESSQSHIAAGSLQGYLEESPFTAGYLAVLRTVDALRGNAVPESVAVPYRFIGPDLGSLQRFFGLNE